MTTRSLVRGEALLTQLLFDHALRLRMKDSMEEDEKKAEEKRDGHAAALSDIEIRVEEVTDHAESGPDDTLIGDGTWALSPNAESSDSSEVGSSNGSNKKGKSVDKKAAADEEAKKTKGQGLAGKINVLMAADVEAVLEGQRSPNIRSS